MNATGLPATQGHELPDETEEPGSPRLERPNTRQVRAVLAFCSPVERYAGPVGSTAIRAVPASKNRLHEVPASRLAARDLSRDASRLSLRASANPPSAISDGVEVAFPLNARTFVVQWRRIRPARGDAGVLTGSAQLPHVSAPESIRVFRASTGCAIRLLKFGTHSPYPLSSPRPAAGTRLSCGVGPSEGIGMPNLSHVPITGWDFSRHPNGTASSPRPRPRQTG